MRQRYRYAHSNFPFRIYTLGRDTPEFLGPLAKVWPLGQKLDIFENLVWPLRAKPEDF